MTEGFLSGEMLLFLFSKPMVKLISERCDQIVEVRDPRRWRAQGTPPVVPRGTVRVCGAPVWNDGRISGVWHGMCSKCWHNSQLFKGDGYRLFRANAAAEGITDTSLERLYVDRKLDGSPRDTVFDPVEWEQREDWDDFEEAA